MNESSVATIALLLALAAFVPLAAGCGEDAQVQVPPAEEEDHAGEEAGDHEGHGHAEGETHGFTIDIGDHAYLGDVDPDPETGSLTLTVLDHAKGEPHPHQAGKAVLNLVLDGGTKQVALEPAPLESDPAGKTSRYRASNAVLEGLEEPRGRVNLSIDGKTYVCDLGARH